MKVCGVELKGNEAIFAVAETTNGEISHVPLKTKKIELSDDDNASSVKSFAQSVENFVRENDIKEMAVKKRGKKGDFAGGPTSFKIEGVLQMLSDCEVTLMSPQTIKAQERKLESELPNSLLKYQEEAFKTARAAITKSNS